jgi:hypothetical protein
MGGMRRVTEKIKTRGLGVFLAGKHHGFYPATHIETIELGHGICHPIDFHGSLTTDIQDANLATLEKIVSSQLLPGSLKLERSGCGDRGTNNRTICLPIVQLDGIRSKERL